MSLADAITTILSGTTGTIVPRAFMRGYDAAAPLDEFPRAQCLEVLDHRICPLCAHVDGMIFDRSSAAYARYRLPSHINCRRTWAFISAREVGPDGRPTRPDFAPPPPELVEKHGHFISDEKRYADLRVPARPTGRDFIAYRPRLPGGGQARHVVLRWRDGLAREPLRETLETMASGFTDLVGLPNPGDRELALQILDHAAARSLLSNLKLIHEKAAIDWPAAALTPDDVAAIPARLLSSEADLVTNTSDAGRPEWVLYRPDLPIGPDRALDEVSAFYDPLSAEFTDIRRLPEAGVAVPPS